MIKRSSILKIYTVYRLLVFRPPCRPYNYNKFLRLLRLKVIVLKGEQQFSLYCFFVILRPIPIYIDYFKYFISIRDILLLFVKHEYYMTVLYLLRFREKNPSEGLEG